MRFCLASTQADWGGGEKLLWSIRTALIEQGHAVCWILRRDQPLHALVTKTGDQVVATLMRRGINPREWFSVVGKLRQCKPEVLLMNDSHAIMLGGSAALLAGRCRPYRLAFRHVTFPIRSPFKLRMMCDSIVCVSQAARQGVLDAGIAAQRTVVIYGGCEPAEDDIHARAWAAAQLHLEPETPLLVCVGNLLECKGHLPMLEAMARLRGQTPPVHLAIAGEGHLRQRIVERIEALKLQDCVHLLGFRRDADRWLSAASIVLHPSLQEGLSLVLIQAQLLRKLIVSTGVGGAAEVLGLGEANPCPVWRARPDDPASLAEQIGLALTAWRTPPADLAERLEQAAQRAREKFDISRNVAQLVEHVRNHLQS